MKLMLGIVALGAVVWAVLAIWHFPSAVVEDLRMLEENGEFE